MPWRGKDHQPVNLTALHRLQGIGNLYVVLTNLKLGLCVAGEVNQG
jgi:hypothetical protein